MNLKLFHTNPSFQVYYYGTLIKQTLARDGMLFKQNILGEGMKFEQIL